MAPLHLIRSPWQLPALVHQSCECLPLQSPTKTRKARTCPFQAALRTRPSNTAPSAPLTALAPPPQPQLPPLHPLVVPPRQTRAQRRTSHGGARPRPSCPAADGPAAGRGDASRARSPEGGNFLSASVWTPSLSFFFSMSQLLLKTISLQLMKTKEQAL